MCVYKSRVPQRPIRFFRGNQRLTPNSSVTGRMTKIMVKYLLPAGFEFQKVLSDFERLAAGKGLFDSDILERIVNASDNNQRFDLLEAFDENVLPLFDNIAEVYPDVRASLLRAAVAARETPTRPIETEFWRIDGKVPEAVVGRILEILLRLRYVDVEATFDALAELYLGGRHDRELADVIKAAKRFAKHDLNVWRQFGPVVQLRLLDKIVGLDENHRQLLRPLITEIYRCVLNPEVTGTSSTSDTVTILTGPGQ